MPSISSDLILVKLGGSLLTDKRRSGHAREAVIARLAAEMAAARGDQRVILGHGSGSFGHVAAAAHGIVSGVVTQQAAAVAAVQKAAATLHRKVVDSLEAAGANPFSLPPSAFVVGASRPSIRTLVPLERALDLSLLPVVYGDMLLERRGGASVCSTETLFRALVPRLRRRGWRVCRMLWLGETAGILDPEGNTVTRVDRRNLGQVRRSIAAPAGTDVTGGMMLRLETARALARSGVESLIADGTVPGLLAAALRCEAVAGTRVVADDATD